MVIRIGGREMRGPLAWLVAIPVLLLVGLVLVPILLGVGAIVVGALLLAGVIVLGVLGVVFLPVLGIPLLVLAPLLLPFVLIGLMLSLLAGSPLLIFLFIAALLYLVYRWWQVRAART